MKLLHTSDWHLGDSFHGYDRTNEHRHFLNWLREIIGQEHPDALLVSGDVFDNANPSAQAERLFFDFIDRTVHENPHLHIVITAGNHDSSLRLEAPRVLLRRLGVEVRGLVSRDDKGRPDYDDLLIPLAAQGDSEDKAVVMAVPYLRADDYPAQDKSTSEGVRCFIDELTTAARKAYGKEMPLVLMAHFYAAGADINQWEHSERLVVGGQDCVDASELTKGLAYAALGHIHKAQQVGKQTKARYAGSVMPMSFAEKGYHHGIVCVELQEGKTDVRLIEYEPLRTLLTIPDEGQGGMDEVMNALSKLPKASGDNARWPYVEVRVHEPKPDPTATGKIVKLMEGRAARLCRIVRVRPSGERTGDTTPIATVDDLQKINPAQIARTIYKNVYGEEMPDEIARLFALAKRKSEEAHES